MQFEKHFLKLGCLFCSLIGISLIYFSSLLEQPKEVSISELNADMVGFSATVVGRISKVRFHQDGHVFLTLTDGRNVVQVPLFASFLKASSIDISKLKVGAEVLVSGTVDVYKSQLQILPRKTNDLQILGG
jgi:DNA/RNA endonuclease YhcR with UshA esterase domain